MRLFSKSTGLRFPYLRYALALSLLLAGASLGLADEKKNEPVQLTKYLALGVKVERLVNSHTSYEFGNPFPPYQAPLSRLEFPLDSWWGGVELRFSTPRFSVGGEVLTNALGDTNGLMKDSDWDDDMNPKVLTMYSESKCRMERSYRARIDADLEVADWLGLPAWLSMRPLIGFRYQRFHVVTHDGVQYNYFEENPRHPLPGDGISFKQQYLHYYVGLRSHIDAGRHIGLSDLKLSIQFDWAYVDGSNKDHHLLRAGNRFTYEDTSGHALHGSVGLKKSLTKNLYLGLQAEYLQIRTTGSHRLVHDLYNIDFKFSHGVKVWSEQTSIGLTLEYRF